MTPQRAFFARSCAVPVSSAVGRVSAELVAIYPPGIPILAPGERVTDALLAMLRDATTSGSRVAYAADPGLKTLRIVDSV